MQSSAETIEQYLAEIPIERASGFDLLRKAILDNLPIGFKEVMNYGMIGYVVPHSLYPQGYHCNTELPLPFVNIASQKNFIGLYHMGIYAIPELLSWFVKEFPKHSKRKLNMGKSCIRFNNPNHIPFELIAQLMREITPSEWIEMYESRNS
jgi:hypothetical protein